jgi:hypothetical protein
MPLTMNVMPIRIWKIVKIIATPGIIVSKAEKLNWKIGKIDKTQVIVL